MKYIKGTQTSLLVYPDTSDEDMKYEEKRRTVKLRLTDKEGYAETPWARWLIDKDRNDEGYALLNHAMAFTPYPSWGAIIPSRNFMFVDMLQKQELTLHPEAFDYYFEQKWIDKDGNALQTLN